MKERRSESGFQIYGEAGCRFRNAECGMWNAECGMRNADGGMRISGFRGGIHRSVPGHWARERVEGDR
jgi:hypothetical protein